MSKVEHYFVLYLSRWCMLTEGVCTGGAQSPANELHHKRNVSPKEKLTQPYQSVMVYRIIYFVIICIQEPEKNKQAPKQDVRVVWGLFLSNMFLLTNRFINKITDNKTHIVNNSNQKIMSKKTVKICKQCLKSK